MKDTMTILFKCRGCGAIKRDSNEIACDVIKRCLDGGMWYAFDVHKCTNTRTCVADFIESRQKTPRLVRGDEWRQHLHVL